MEHIKPQSEGVYSSEPRHEKTDANIPAILVFGVALFVMAVVVHVVLYGMYKGLDKWTEMTQAEPMPMMQQPKNDIQANAQLAENQQQAMQRLAATFPEPRLQADEFADMARMKEAHTMQMTNYMWRDPNAGTVTIPIDQAMKLIGERGLPNVGAGPAPVATATPGQAPATAPATKKAQPAKK